MKTVEETGHPHLADFLGLSPLSKVTKKDWLGKSYIRLYDYFKVLWFLYESGALLGRAMRDKVRILEKVLASSGEVLWLKDWESASHWQEKASFRLKRWVKRFGKEPNTFREFIFIRELRLATGLDLSDSLDAFASGNKEMLKAYNKKIPKVSLDRCTEVSRAVGQTEARMRTFLLEGIGFGIAFPELTEKMLRNYYESIFPDTYEWAKVKSQGYAVPTVLSLNEQQDIVLVVLAHYAEGYHPRLFKRLGLERLKDIERRRYFRTLTWWSDWALLDYFMD